MNIESINIEIVRTTRKKTVSVFIERDGTVRALAPASVSQSHLEASIRQKQYQIFIKLARWKELNQGKVSRPFLNGQSFLYLGRNYRLSIVNEQAVPLQITNGYFSLRKSDLPSAKKVFIRFYKEKAQQKIEERLKIIQKKFSQHPDSIKVSELGNRWASWTPKHRLHFHWKCVLAPVSVIDYIITHEMVHLVHPNHSAKFWDELDKKMPNFREYEEWLRVNGVKLTV